MERIDSQSQARYAQEASSGRTEAAREFVYPVVTEVLRAGAAPPGAGSGGFARLPSQRELVEASLVRRPDVPPAPLSSRVVW